MVEEEHFEENSMVEVEEETSEEKKMVEEEDFKEEGDFKEEETKEKEAIVICPYCSREFFNEGLLAKHCVLLHSEAEVMECEECEAIFKRRIRLVQHLRSTDHTGRTT